MGWGRTIYYDGSYCIGEYNIKATKSAKKYDINGN
jgi:hypothetical protein